MKSKVSLHLLLVFVLMISLLAGCGSKNEEVTNNGSDTKDTSTTENTIASESEGLSGDFEIQYFVGGYGDAWWKEVIREFQAANPALNIKQTAGPKINEQMKPRWIQGNPPDVVYIDGAGSNARQMVEDDQLLDITDWLKEAANVDGEKILDHVISKPVDFDGKFFNLPLVFGSWGVFYDKALFKEKGWNEPTDWDSFLEVSQKIKDAGISPMIHTGVYPYYIHGGLLDSAFVTENGEDATILTNMAALKEGAFKTDAVKKALDKIVQLRDKGFIDPGSVSLNHTDSQSLWLQHRNAFIPNGLWLENEMKKDIPSGFDFGFVPSVTQAKGGKSIAVPYINTIAVAKKAKNPEAAKAFIQFIFTKKASIRWAELTGALMNWKVNLDSSSASGVVKSAMKFYNSDTTIVAPVFELNSDVDKVKQDSTVALTQGTITPEEWMNRLEEAAAKARK